MHKTSLHLGTVVAVLVAALALVPAFAEKGGSGGGKPGGGDPPPPAAGDPAIAYLQDTRYTGSGAGELWVMDADGANPTKLLDEGVALPPKWNPEGTALAFGGDFRAPEGDGIYVLFREEDGSWRGPTRIVQTWSQTFKLDWSPTAPDGKQYLAFETFMDRDGNGLGDDTDIFVVEVDLDGPPPVLSAVGGGDALRVTDTPRHRERHPAWSADGTKLAFTSNSVADEFESPHDLIVVTFTHEGGLAIEQVENLSDAGDLLERPLDEADVRQPCWARGRDELVVLTRGAVTELWVLPYASPGDAACLTCAFDAQAVVQPCWSPDDLQILYNGSNDEYPSGALWLVDAAGTVRTELVGRSGKFRGKYPANRYQPTWRR